MTDARSGGLASPAFEGCERFVLSGAGIAGRGLWRAAKALLAIAAGTHLVRRHYGAKRKAAAKRAPAKRKATRKAAKRR